MVDSQSTWSEVRVKRAWSKLAEEFLKQTQFEYKRSEDKEKVVFSIKDVSPEEAFKLGAYLQYSLMEGNYLL